MEEQIFRIRDGRLWHFNKKLKMRRWKFQRRLREIGEGVFQNSVNLERITIPESMTDIEGFSFDTSWKLRKSWAGADIGKALSGGGYGFSI